MDDAAPTVALDDRTPTLDAPDATTWVGVLRQRSAGVGSYRFLPDEGDEQHLPFTQLLPRVAAVARALGDQPAGPVALVHPPGLDYVVALLGAWLAGRVAVPVHPPEIGGPSGRLEAILADCRATVVAATTAQIEELEVRSGFRGLRLLPTDKLGTALDPGHPEPDPQALALLQYTSGSTRTPRGVRLTHANLLANSETIRRALRNEPGRTGVFWLPPYHDMGLVGAILQVLYADDHAVLMSPGSFVHRPLRWVEAISRFGGGVSAAPTFAYDLCARRASPSRVRGLDLSRWEVALCGAEPVRADVLRRFAEAFAPAGFRAEALMPSYGLAEATLMVTARPPGSGLRTLRVDRDALGRGEVVPADDGAELVSCGGPAPSVEVAVVDDRGVETTRVGHVVVRGPSVAQGYLGADPDRAFREGALWTGDLGFLRDGELYLVGRSKDVLVVRGRKHHATDLEDTADTVAGVRPGRVCAAAWDDAGEVTPVVMLEARGSAEPAALIRAVQDALRARHGVSVEVAVVGNGQLPRTTSGKRARAAALAALREGRLTVLARTPGLERPEPSDEAPLLDEMRAQLASILRCRPQDIDPADPLTDQAFDSLTAAELGAEIRARYGVEVPMSALFDGVSLARLAEAVAATMVAGGGPLRLDAEGTPTPVADPAPASTSATPLPALSLFFFESTDVAGPQAYDHLLRVVETADAAGFEAAWLPERHFHAFGAPFPNPALLAAALAVRTRRIGLRAGSVVLPLHSPVRVAEEWAMVDVLSGGRAGVSFTSGWNPRDFVLAPGRFEHRRTDHAAAIEQVRQLWAGEAITLPDGRGAPVEVRAFPRPIRGAIPIWSTCTRAPERFEEAGALGQNVLTNLLLQDLDDLARNIERYRAAWQRAGHPGRGTVTVALHTFVAPTDALARAVVARPFRAYLASSVALWSDRSAELATLGQAERDRAIDFALERQLRTALIGSPAVVRERLVRLAALGVDEVACQVDFGVPPDAVLEGFERLVALRDPIPPDGLRPSSTAPAQADGWRLTPEQERLWFLQELSPGSTAHCAHAAVRLRGRLRPDALRDAVRTVTARHPLVTARIEVGADGPRLRPGAAPELRELTVDDLDRAVAREAARPFDLRGGELVRLVLLSAGPDAHVLLLSAHHLAVDEGSMRIVLRELATAHDAALEGVAPDLPPVRGQWEDHVRTRSGEADPDHLAHWRQALAGAVPLTLPTDRTRPAVPSGRGARVRVDLGPASVKVRALARRAGVTPYAAVLATFAHVLGRSANQDDVVIGTATSLRPAGLDDVVGLFTDVAALRLALAPVPVVEALRRAHRVVLDALAHPAPFQAVVTAAEVARDPRLHPVFQVFLAWQGRAPLERTFAGLEAEAWEPSSGGARFDLELHLVDDGERISGFLEYATDLFDPATVERLGERWTRFASAAADAPEAPIGSLPVLLPAEEALLDEVHGPRAAWDLATPLHALVERTVTECPDAIAVRFGDETLTYAALDARARGLAAELVRRGAGPGTRVGVCLERSLALPVALLAILQAGAAYLPLVPSLPDARLRAMVEDARPVVVVADPEQADRLGVEIVPPDASAPPVPLPELDGEAVLYVMYTSGSTGSPKGVEVPHRAVVNRLRWMQAELPLGPGDATLLQTSIGFDLSVPEVFRAWLAGATVVVAPPDAHRDPAALAALVRRHGVSELRLVPTMLAAFLDEPATRDLPLARVLSGGEALPWATMTRFLERHPGVALYNLYGPTETAIEVAHWRCVATPGEVTIGRASANCRLYVLDADLRRVPVGTIGELYIGGDQLARGYLGRPDETAARFLPDPYAKGARMYRTGDLARVREDGLVVCLGRVDDQVKIRGHRVELGEIEAALRALPDVREAAVLLDDGRLHAFVVGAGSTGSALASLRERLPAFMVPATLTPVDAIPATSNGKRDRRALLAQVATVARTGAGRAPSTSAERALAGAWSQVLGVPVDDAGADFFALGGDSIRSLQVRSRLASDGLGFALADLFAHPTLEALAARLVPTEMPSGPADMPWGPASRRPYPSDPLAPDERARLGADVVAWPAPALAVGLIAASARDGHAYVDTHVWRLASTPPVDALRAAVARSVARHPVLRSAFDLAGVRRPLQVAAPALDPLPLAVVDWRDRDPAAVEADLAGARAELRSRPFDPARPPLWALTVHLLPQGGAQVALHAHHALLDGWSAATWLAEVLADASGAEVPPPPDLHAAHAELERAALADPRHAASWREALEDHRARPLPAGEPGPAVHERRLPTERVEALTRRAAALRVPLQTLLLAVHLRALALATGAAEAVAGIVVPTRPEVHGAERALGLLVNTVPVRADAADGSWAALVRRIQAAEGALWPHRRLPLPAIAQELGEIPFDNLFSFRRFHVTEEIDQLALETDAHEPTDLALVATWRASAAGLRLTVDVDPIRVGRRAVEVWLAAVDAGLRALAEDPDQALAAFDGLGPADRDAHALAQGPSVAGLDRDVVARVIEQARARPDAPALRHRREALTYAALVARAGALAEALRARGLSAGDRVAVEGPPGVARCLWALAVPGAGGVWVPLDPGLPAERRAALVRAAGCRWVVGPRDPGLGIPFVPLELDPEKPGALSADGAPEAELYVLSTSGSTGEPRAVALPRRALANLVGWQLSSSSGGRTAQVAHYGFDVWLQEAFATWAGGETLVVADDELRHDPARLLGWLVEEDIERLFVPPVLLHELARVGRPTALREVVVAGEALELSPALRAFLARSPGVSLVNQYGPAETHVVTAHALTGDPRAWPERPPIGRGIANVGVHVRSDALLPVPVGVPGELWLSGPCLARGYLGRPEATAERFTTLPGVGRAYRTGDRVRLRSDGELEFLGRADRQVKVRGFRVEPGEVEAALRATPTTPALGAVAVVASRGGLVAFVEPDSADVAGLRASLAARLPPYMIPDRIVAARALPRTPSGKVDRKRLVVPPPPRRSAEVAPGSLEDTLADLVGEVLDRERPDADADFFDLGGQSLAAVRLAALVRERLGLELPVAGIFQRRTPRALARALRAAPPAAWDQGVGDRWLPFERADDGPAGRDVLLTGATGFLGSRLLAALLDGPGQVWCPVRAGDPAEARARIEAALRPLGIGRERMRRARPVPADLRQPRLGLTEELWSALATGVGRIVHCAARVHHAEPYAALRADNVDSTRLLLALAAQGAAKRVDLVSTSDVHGFDPAEEASGYTRSKWVAEQLGELAHARGVRVVVSRPALLLGPIPLEGYWPALVIRAAERTGRVPADVAAPIAPVEWAAAAIARQDGPGPAHLWTGVATGEDLVDALARAGVPARATPWDDWREAVLAEPTLAELAPLVGHRPRSVPLPPPPDPTGAPSVREILDATIRWARR